jgi:hypothetical protein
MKTLKQDLIGALEQLELPMPQARRIKLSIDAIRNSHIPSKDISKADIRKGLGFLELLIDEIPQVLQAFPSNARLKTLSNNWLGELDALTITAISRQKIKNNQK